MDHIHGIRSIKRLVRTEMLRVIKKQTVFAWPCRSALSPRSCRRDPGRGLPMRRCSGQRLRQQMAPAPAPTSTPAGAPVCSGAEFSESFLPGSRPPDSRANPCSNPQQAHDPGPFRVNAPFFFPYWNALRVSLSMHSCLKKFMSMIYRFDIS